MWNRRPPWLVPQPATTASCHVTVRSCGSRVRVCRLWHGLSRSQRIQLGLQPSPTCFCILLNPHCYSLPLFRCLRERCLRGKQSDLPRRRTGGQSPLRSPLGEPPNHAVSKRARRKKTTIVDGLRGCLICLQTLSSRYGTGTLRNASSVTALSISYRYYDSCIHGQCSTSR